MRYRRRFYPPEIDDWCDYGFPEERQIFVGACYPSCCPNPNCYPRYCEPSTNYATCCPNPNSKYNAAYYFPEQATGCTPGGSDCRPLGCNPRVCNPRECSPRSCSPRTCRPAD